VTLLVDSHAPFYVKTYPVVSDSSTLSKAIFFPSELRNSSISPSFSVEPRVQKRRPKPFKLLTKPRAELKAELMGVGYGKRY
jgi:hypothetical protein